MTIKTAIIGISGYGATIYDDLLREKQNGAIEFTAATVVNQSEEEEKCKCLKSIGCNIYQNYKEMLAREDLDLCFIPTGIHLHKEMTLDALEAGVNVAVEKPAAATIQDVEEMKKISKKTGKFVAVGYQTMYVPETRLMKWAILDGRLGKIRTIKSFTTSPRNSAYYTRNNWAGKLSINGKWVLDSPFNNAFAHRLNMICFLGGKSFRESARISSLQAELYKAHDIESADTASIRFYSDTGIKFIFACTHACQESMGPAISVIGEKGRIDWDGSSTVVTTDEGLEKIKNSPSEDLRKFLMSGVIKRLSHYEQFICSLDIASAQTLCVNGAHESSGINFLEPEFITEEIVQGGARVRCIRNIESVVKKSFEEEKLFSELNLEWAKPGKPIDMENYHNFPHNKNI
jgi:predicted dehydrogenase